MRGETTVTVSWIARWLTMGTRGYLAHLFLLRARTLSERPPSNQPSPSI